MLARMYIEKHKFKPHYYFLFLVKSCSRWAYLQRMKVVKPNLLIFKIYFSPRNSFAGFFWLLCFTGNVEFEDSYEKPQSYILTSVSRRTWRWSYAQCKPQSILEDLLASDQIDFQNCRSVLILAILMKSKRPLHLPTGLGLSCLLCLPSGFQWVSLAWIDHTWFLIGLCILWPDLIDRSFWHVFKWKN